MHIAESRSVPSHILPSKRLIAPTVFLIRCKSCERLRLLSTSKYPCNRTETLSGASPIPRRQRRDNFAAAGLLGRRADAAPPRECTRCGAGHGHRADRGRPCNNGIGGDAFALILDGQKLPRPEG